MSQWKESAIAPRDGTIVEFNIPRAMTERHGYRKGKYFAAKIPATPLSKERVGLTLAIVRWFKTDGHPNGGFWDSVGKWSGSYSELKGYWRYASGRND